ncbi:flagellar basal-body MS-ring/collar protein FliF [Acetobacterium bakii]|uniref:Flagellar M-ring protein n=1 Tax=Acetobacterium bakii TaxID=52689 RepID=A0A0L6TZR5_9FIRM|nr:flagellar basal-body MS-ring/collar protein FliF [Acetobacterium bakii]KNZ41756.1 hypothetical protein AKG39_08960 [Acetobacterium bakii]
MNEKIKAFLNGIKEFWTGISKQTKGLIVGGLVVVLVGAIALTFLLNVKDYVPIFDDLSVEESTEILAQLKTMSADVKIDSTGAIMVPKEDESKIRMELATAGYPKNGLSYYVIKDNSNMLSTDYERKQYENMQLQERIGASIETLDGIKDAVVTISEPTENVFYLQETEMSTASVIIHLYPGNTLTESQVLGIQNLVAKSVSGLAKDNIALSDGEGNDLISSTSELNGSYSKIKLTREIENDIKKKVNDILDGPYEQSKYKISVTAIINTDSSIKESTVYTPSPDGDNSGVINEESAGFSINGGTATDGGVAGTTTNSEVTTYAQGIIDSGGVITDTTGNKTYSVSQDKTQTEKKDPVLESVSIGIAIDDVNMNPTEKENLIQLVAFSAGVTPQSIAIRNFEFYAEEDNVEIDEENGITMQQLLIIAGIVGGVLLLIVILIIVLVAGKKKKKRKALGAGAQFEQEAMDELFGELAGKAELPDIQPVKDDKKEKIKEFAKTNPEIAAQLFKSWLKNDNE